MYSERPAALPGAVLWFRQNVGPQPAYRVLPDGCLDLIWIDGELLVAGPDTSAFVNPAEEGREYAGIRFSAGIGPAVFGLPAYELLDRRVPLSDVWPAGRARRLAGMVSGAADRGQLLTAIAGDSLAVREPDPVAREVAAELTAGLPVASIARQTGLSERQLLRRCKHAFGYGPKTLMRILRFGRALDAARAGLSYATVAVENGYADQAHLARDVKALAGVPLREL